MISSRKQEFAYQHKTISVADANLLWLTKHSLIVFLPKDLIQIKNLYVDLAVSFDNVTPSQFRKIAWVGGDGGHKNVDQGLVGGIAEFKHDFSDELELFGLDNGQPVMINNQKAIKIEFSCGNTVVENDLIGKVKLWKVDLVYTTQGIR